jgi:hypothetical protein
MKTSPVFSHSVVTVHRVGSSNYKNKSQRLLFAINSSLCKHSLRLRVGGDGADEAWNNINAVGDVWNDRSLQRVAVCLAPSKDPLRHTHNILVVPGLMNMVEDHIAEREDPPSPESGILMTMVML